MAQNLKVDIIYHLTASDFEMEFNLCGCCRMRLLNDKTTDKKGFIKALARDVARSRVIIACGPLFGADSLINTVATAIGSGITVCDNKTYGINDDETIHIIGGSTPLVTSDGYFGGCIIESGPQTIILLTENKAFRKDILQNLIHPYLEEISYIPTKNSSLAPAPAEEDQCFETAVNQDEQYLATPDKQYGEDEFDQNGYETAPIAEDEHNIEFIMDEEPVSDDNPTSEQEDANPLFDNSYNIMYTEIEKPEEIKSRYENPYTPSQSDNMFIASVEREHPVKNNSHKTDMRAMNITIVILALLLLLAVLALVYLIVLKPYTMGVSTGDYLKEIFGLASNSLV